MRLSTPTGIYTYLRLSTPNLRLYLGVNIPFPTLVHELSRYKDAKEQGHHRHAARILVGSRGRSSNLIGSMEAFHGRFATSNHFQQLQSIPSDLIDG